MKIGFTGTQKGLTIPQFIQLMRLIKQLEVNELHHGDCIGADAEAHSIAGDFNIPVVLHPPLENAKRAWCQGAKFVHEPRHYLSRNRHIVLWTDALIATPKGMETLRSGTWSTVRYARSKERKIWVIMPNGEIDTND